MPETVRDDALMRQWFGEFRDAETPRLTLAEVGTLRATVRRRRRTGVVLAAAALALVSVTPILVVRSMSTASEGDRNGPAAGQAPPALGRCPASAASSKLDLAATATDLLLGPANTGPRKTWRLGEMTVRICNLGGVPAPAGTFTLRWLATVPAAKTTDGNSKGASTSAMMGEGPWKDCDYDRPEGTPVVDGVAYYLVQCAYPPLPARTSKAFTFYFHTLGDADAGIDRPAVHYAEVAADGDANPGNDRATFKIRIR